MNESKAFSDLRTRQREGDEANGAREASGRAVATLPPDFVFLYRVIGLLRGVTAELEVECPIMHIFALHAKCGLLREVSGQFPTSET